MLVAVVFAVSCATAAGGSTSTDAPAPTPSPCPLGAPVCSTSTSLQILDSKGRYVRTLSLPKAVYSEPSWSPDGKAIAAVKVGDQGDELLVIDLATLKTRAVASVGARGWISDPSWSPDGRSIAFVKLPPSPLGSVSTRSEIDVISSSGGTPSRLEFRRAVAWSPDGRWIAATTLAGYVSLIHPDGSSFRTLPDKGYAAWSPDGSTLAIATAQRSVISIPLDGGPATTIARRGQLPAWTPDGHHITFLNFAKDYRFTIHIVNPDGTDMHQFSSFVTIGFSWSPAGHEIVATVPAGPW